MSKKQELKRTLCALLMALTFNGCASGKEAKCDYPTKHAHEYTGNFADGSSITAYFIGEYEKLNGLFRQEQLFEITNKDEKKFELITNKGLFIGKDNWKYLYNQMKRHPDYLEFYYEYEEVKWKWETKTRINSEGEEEEYSEYVKKSITHSGWTLDSKYEHNTGRVCLYHYKYYGYKIIEENDVYLQQSPLVDDIRDAIKEGYIYFKLDPSCKVSSEYNISKSELPTLTIDYFTTYAHPDLENPNLDLDGYQKVK